MLRIGNLTNGNLLLDGLSALGAVKEMEMPSITQKMVDHQALGMIGMLELPSGIDKMEMKVTMNTYDVDLMVKAANPYKAVNLQFRGSLERWVAGTRVLEQGVVCHMVGTFKELPLGSFAQHERPELSTTISVSSIRLLIANAEVLSIDVSANIYRVNGVDLTVQYRNNIGQ